PGRCTRCAKSSAPRSAYTTDSRRFQRAARRRIAGHDWPLRQVPAPSYWLQDGSPGELTSLESASRLPSRAVLRAKEAAARFQVRFQFSLEVFVTVLSDSIVCIASTLPLTPVATPPVEICPVRSSRHRPQISSAQAKGIKFRRQTPNISCTVYKKIHLHSI